MRINAEKIFKNEGLSSDYTFSLDLSDCEFWGEYPFKTPIEVAANLSNRAGMVVLTTHATVRFETGCARCTKGVVLDIPIDTENYVVTEYENQDDNSMILAEDYIIDLDEIAEFAVITSAPMKVLCKDDCKGLCPKCGKDLNEGKCDCPEKEPDPRLAILKNLL